MQVLHLRNCSGKRKWWRGIGERLHLSCKDFHTIAAQQSVCVVVLKLNLRSQRVSADVHLYAECAVILLAEELAAQQ